MAVIRAKATLQGSKVFNRLSETNINEGVFGFCGSSNHTVFPEVEV